MNGLNEKHWVLIFAVFAVFSLQSARVCAQTVDNSLLGKPVTTTPLDRSNPEFQITERGAHHRKWERMDTITRPDGEEEEVIRSYTELGSGLNYWDEDAEDWIESKAIIEPFEGGAVARQGQTKAIFAPALGDPAGTIDVLAADGQRFRSVVLGLAYYDPVSGDDLILSETNPDAVGEILDDNKVLYRNAFTEIRADLLYEYCLDGVSQNVILRQPPVLSPVDLGMSAEGQLQVISEFLESPVPAKDVRVVRPLALGATAPPAAVEADLIDEKLDFGAIGIGTGRAFDLADEGGSDVMVTKRWETIEGRSILFEGVVYQEVEGALNRLPKAEAQWRQGRREVLMARNQQTEMRIPGRRVASLEPTIRQPLRLASVPLQSKDGYLIDYELVGGSLTDFVFESGKTYYVSASTSLLGNTVFEGGAVIKNWGTFFQLKALAEFRTSEYSPLIVTSKDDDSVGEVINGSSGTPPTPENATGFFFTLDNLNGQVVENVRIRYGGTGFYCIGGSNLRLRNIQIMGCKYAIGGSGTNGVNVENALVDHCVKLWGANLGWVGSHVTLHDLDSFGHTDVELKNSLIVDVDSTTYIGKGASHNVELSSATGVFQSAGSGHFYLATGSPYRDLGTASIDPDLEAALEKRTTSPPTVYDAPAAITSNTTWSAHVARDDNGTLDLGFHYPAIDYLVKEVVVDQQATLSIEPGTGIGAYGPTAIRINDQASLHALGTVTQPIRVGWYGDLQDGTDPARVSPYSHTILFPQDASPVGTQNELWLQHTKFYPGAFYTGEKYAIRADSSGAHIRDLWVHSCEFECMAVYVVGLTGNQHDFINNDINDGQLCFSGAQALVFHNNLSEDLNVTFSESGAIGPWEMTDNLFTEIWSGTSSGNLEADHNAYFDTSFRINQSTSPNDLELVSLAFESGPFGNHYQPTGSALIDAGSRLADAAGLMHHTILATGPPEGTATSMTTIDIGLHYPADDSGTGLLLDEDGDGLANVLEDLNGNGLYDSGETHWEVVGPYLDVFTPLD